jgi:hypothetical protein
VIASNTGRPTLMKLLMNSAKISMQHHKHLTMSYHEISIIKLKIFSQSKRSILCRHLPVPAAVVPIPVFEFEEADADAVG